MRSEIDPVQIAHALSITFLCDYERASGRLRYRLVGEDIAERYNVPLRGRYQDEAYSIDEREGHLARVACVMETPAIIHTIGAVHVIRRRLGIGERLGLPLGSDGHTADGLIGATAYDWQMPEPSDLQAHRALGWTVWSLDGDRVLCRQPIEAG